MADDASRLFERLSGMANEQEFTAYINSDLKSIEAFHFDFKEKQDRQNPDLGEDDKRNLAKAVSGFANSGGGVLIWGVKDGTLEQKPVKDVELFARKLLSLSANISDPIVKDINGATLSSLTPQHGYAFLYIPSSHLPPHRVILNQKDVRNRYYMRTADSFVEPSHSQLQDMFGSRIRPSFAIRLSAARFVEPANGKLRYVALTLELKNVGRGAAKAPAIMIGLSPGLRLFTQSAKNSYYFHTPAERIDRYDYQIQSDNFEPNGSIAVTGSDHEIVHSGLSAYFSMLLVDVDKFVNSNGQRIFESELECQVSADGIQPQRIPLPIRLFWSDIAGQG